MTSPSQVNRFKGPFCRATQSEGTHGSFKATPSLPCAPRETQFSRAQPSSSQQQRFMIIKRFLVLVHGLQRGEEVKPSAEEEIPMR
jgi:hypothetical protein